MELYRLGTEWDINNTLEIKHKSPGVSGDASHGICFAVILKATFLD
jgi:hypothetical protein